MCLKMEIISVDLTELSSLTITNKTGKKLLLMPKILIFQQYNYNNSSNWNILPLLDVWHIPL